MRIEMAVENNEPVVLPPEEDEICEENTSDCPYCLARIACCEVSAFSIYIELPMV